MSTLVRRIVRPALVAAATAGLVLGASLSVSAAPVAGTASASSPSGTPDAWTSPTSGSGNTFANLGETQISADTAGELQRAWSRSAPYAGFGAVSIADGVVYTTIASNNGMVPWHFVALDARTGARLWQTLLPLGSYYRGVSLVGSTALLPYDGAAYPGGLVALDLAAHKVRWNRSLGQDANGTPYVSSQTVAVDSGRAIMAGGQGLTAYDVATGRPLWTHVYSYPHSLNGYAAAGGVVFAGGEGVLALDGATGRQLWQGSQGIGYPVVADGRVVVSASDAVVSYPIGGCGAASCDPGWRTPLGPFTSFGAVLGGAGGGTLFASYVVRKRSSTATQLLRLDAGTGKVQWSTRFPGPGGFGLVRAGDLMWTQRTAQNGGTVLAAYPATGSSSTEVASVREPGLGGYPQGVAVAGGSLVLSELTGGLFAFRVPGS